MDENETNVVEEESLGEKSILETVKALVGIGPNYNVFDDLIIIYTNSVFVNLAQLGIGPSAPFRISGRKEKWSVFIRDNDAFIHMVEPYVGFKVRLMFDPSLSSAVQNSIDKTTAELEWRMIAQVETPPVDNVFDEL